MGPLAVVANLGATIALPLAFKTDFGVRVVQVIKQTGALNRQRIGSIQRVKPDFRLPVSTNHIGPHVEFRELGNPG